MMEEWLKNVPYLCTFRVSNYKGVINKEFR